MWGVLQQRVYRSRIRDVDHLKQRLIEEWRCFDQNIIDRAVRQWRVRLRASVQTAATLSLWVQTVTGVFVYELLRRLFHIGNLCFWVPFLKQLLFRNCAVDFVEICNIYVRKMIIKAAKRILNPDKICRSYSDLNFGVTFLEHSSSCSFRLLIGSRIWAFDWYQNRWPWMTLNGVMAVILRYFTEFGKHAFQHITASICCGIYVRVYNCIL